jgi:hypothetical protein
MPKRTKAQGNISMVFVAIDAAIAAAIVVIWQPDLPDRGTLSTALRPAYCNANAKAKCPRLGAVLAAAGCRAAYPQIKNKDNMLARTMAGSTGQAGITGHTATQRSGRDNHVDDDNRRIAAMVSQPGRTPVENDAGLERRLDVRRL